jgi:hypothetical protein
MYFLSLLPVLEKIPGSNSEIIDCKGGADADQQRKIMMMSTYTSVQRTHSNNVTMNKTFDSNEISIDNRSR